MEWKEQFATAIPSVDNQHKQLFRLVGSLETAMRKGLSKSRFIDILEQLGTYAARHFILEEKLMETSGYPGLAKQQAEHQGLIRRLATIRKQLEIEGFSGDLADALHDEIVRWIRQHVTELDKLFGTYYQSRQAG